MKNKGTGNISPDAPVRQILKNITVCLKGLIQRWADTVFPLWVIAINSPLWLSDHLGIFLGDDEEVLRSTLRCS